MSTHGQPAPQWGMPSDFNPSDHSIGPSRRQSTSVGRKSNLVPYRVPDIPDNSGSPELQLLHSSNPVNAKLDRLLSGFSKLESRIDSTDHRITNLEPLHKPDPDPPYDYLDVVDGDTEHQHRNLHPHRATRPCYHVNPQRGTRFGYAAHFSDNPIPRPHYSGYYFGGRPRHDRQIRSAHHQPNQFSDFPQEQLPSLSSW